MIYVRFSSFSAKISAHPQTWKLKSAKAIGRNANFLDSKQIGQHANTHLSTAEVKEDEKKIRNVNGGPRIFSSITPVRWIPHRNQYTMELELMRRNLSEAIRKSDDGEIAWIAPYIPCPYS